MSDTVDSAGVEIGLISDTHGLLRPEALTALAGVEHIIHAGDVGPAEILDALSEIAPLTWVRGNTDMRAAADDWPPTAVVRAGGRNVYVVHDIDTLDLDPRAAGMAAVVYGHSHRPDARLRDGVLYVNPGAAGPRRFSLPVTVARLRISADELVLTSVDLETGRRGAAERYEV